MLTRFPAGGPANRSPMENLRSSVVPSAIQIRARSNLNVIVRSLSGFARWLRSAHPAGRSRDQSLPAPRVRRDPPKKVRVMDSVRASIPLPEVTTLRPTGTVTFLFTDIEGSTERWDRLPEEMRLALRRHDAILRAGIEAHGGLVFKTIGDAFCAAFASAGDAVKAAIRVQRELLAEDWSAVNGVRVRMALHTGVTDERGDDYFGPPVNRVARLLSTAHGGQVLLSNATRTLIHDQIGSQYAIVDLGEHRLKNIATPEHVYQLAAPDLPQTFPPLRSADARPNNLSQPLTTFIEQGNDLHRIEELIAGRSLVTLIGAGGIGKSRHALEVGNCVLDHFADGVWFV